MVLTVTTVPVLVLDNGNDNSDGNCISSGGDSGNHANDGDSSGDNKMVIVKCKECVYLKLKIKFK